MKHALRVVVLLCLSLAGIHMAAAQSKVTGTVRDARRNPVPGVNVVLSGTTNGTSSDTEGNFTLSVPSLNGTLVFSSIGYERREVPIGGRANLDIELAESAALLNEAVVVGYGTQKKVNLTGATEQIGSEILENRPVARISQALQGAVGNLNISTGTTGGAPNATQSINIRGYTGLGTSGSPLIVIDGIQGGDLNSINPSDIESITVLKDAASAAIYGSSAPYGVILVNTKQGKKGKGASITYNNNLSWAQPINLPKMVNSLDFANLYNEAFKNAGRAPAFDDETIQRIKDYQAGKITTETIASPVAGSNSWLTWASSNANHDWFKIYFKDFAFSQQHNVGVTGGSDKTTYYVGGGYNYRGGMYNFGTDTYKRFNIRANVTSDLTRWLGFSFRSSASRQLYDTPNLYGSKTGGGNEAYMHQIARKFPTVALFNPDGNYSSTSDVLLHEQGGRNKTVTDQVMLTGEFNVKFTKDWTATANYTLDGSFYDAQSHQKTLYEFLPDGSKAVIGGTSPSSFSRNNERNFHHIVNAFTSYEKQEGSHYFKVLGGYVRDLTEFQSYSASNSLLYSDNIPSLNTSYGTSPTIGDNIRKLASEGFFGRINYNFKEKYLLEINGRYDGTSRFLQDVRWKFYPGISAGWNVDRESFFEPLAKTVTAFKIRGSYGQLGDQYFLDANAPNWYPFYPSLSITKPTSTSWLFGSGQEAAVNYPTMVNPMLTWVTTKSSNIGADIALFNNRLTSSFDWYVRKADDFAGPSQALPAILGAAPPTANNAAIETRGFELTIGWNDHIGDVRYGLRGVLSNYSGKVVKYPNPNGTLSTYYEGQKMGEIWGYQSVGLFRSEQEVAEAPAQTFLSAAAWTPGDVRYADLNGDGKIDAGNSTLANPGDRRVIGNSTPRYSYSFTGDLAWKGFDLQVFLQGIAKRDVFIGSNYFFGIVGNEWQSSVFTVHQDRWTAENPNGYFPKFYMSDQNSKNTQTQTRYLQNAAYLRIKNLQLGYSLPPAVMKAIRLQRVRVYLSAENLATFTKLVKTLDPELSIGSGKIYPLQRTFSAGLNVTF
ncbi:SusC/RagA family TonB-linked outer membrane protein [Dyadobacter jiangsuensis]|uniref:TonB-linked SusC/RagA family outer membrane protein n=1 Tax=Dyadobacter jiangsuensis TaxID=1591085 RepID=A0A2P8FQ51_9BACT|nr:TonB-dependent receptor [Dyadobacter jiangsuensis]PSL23856.1 TonB-linked SusC/RagA family outer membrane protein [Dyadobacter jiangsuensis]